MRRSIAKALDLLHAFGAPTSVVFRLQHEYAASSSAQRHDIPYLYGEFGGAATVDATAADRHERNLRSLAKWASAVRTACSCRRRASRGNLLETVTGRDFRDLAWLHLRAAGRRVRLHVRVAQQGRLRCARWLHPRRRIAGTPPTRVLRDGRHRHRAAPSRARRGRRLPGADRHRTRLVGGINWPARLAEQQLKMIRTG